MILATQILLVSLFLVARSAATPQLDPVKMRDKILATRESERLEIVLVSELIRNLRLHVELNKHQDSMEHDGDLDTDLALILEATESNTDDCRFEYLQSRLEHERHFGPQYVNLNPYLKQLNRTLFGRCLIQLDRRYPESIEQLSLDSVQALEASFEYGKLNVSKKVSIPTGNIDGFSSTDPWTNIQTRYFMSSAARYIRYHLTEAEDPSNLVQFERTFKRTFEFLFSRSCQHLYDTLGINIESSTLNLRIRKSHGISHHPSSRDMQIICNYIGLNPAGYQILFQYFMRHLWQSPLPQVSPSLIDPLLKNGISPTDSFLNYFSLMTDNDEISRWTLHSSYEVAKSLQDALDAPDLYPTILHPQLRLFADIAEPARSKCDEVSIGALSIYVRRHKARETKHFLEDYVSKQLEICELVIWLRVGASLEGTDNGIVRIEQLRRLVSKAQREKNLSGQYWLTRVDPLCIIQGSADLMALENFELGDGASMHRIYRNWMNEICTRFGGVLEQSFWVISAMLNAYYDGPGELNYDVAPLTFDCFLYEKICDFGNFGYWSSARRILYPITNTRRVQMTLSELMESLKSA